MKFCPNCGQQAEDDLMFCENCGASLNKPAAEPEPVAEPAPAPIPKPEVAPTPAPMPDPYITPMPDPYATPVPAEPAPVVEPAPAPVATVPAPVKTAAPAAVNPVHSNSKPAKKKSSALPVILAIVSILLVASLAVNALFVWPGFLNNDGGNDKKKDEKANEANEDVAYQDAIDKLQKIADGEINEETLKAFAPGDNVWDFYNIDDNDIIDDREDALSYIGVDPENISMLVEEEKDSAKELDGDEIEDIVNSLKDTYDEEFDITAAYEVTFICTTTADLDDIEDEDERIEIEENLEEFNADNKIDLIAVQIDDEWYLYFEGAESFYIPGIDY